MKNFFVIGSKVSKSLSPLIFNHWFKKYKLKAKYTFIEVKEADFDKVVNKKIQDRNVAGFNVTTPYKKNIIKYVEVKNIHAKNIEAANCITLDIKIKGSNTDWIGYLNSIKAAKIRKKDKILILGYGGASQAIYYGFSLKGFKNILVFNRSKKKINFKSTNRYTKKYSTINKHLKEADLIINTTPTNPLNEKQTKLIKKGTVISDIVYQPKETRFLKNFKENKKIYGISMLIEQAIPCFRQWFGFEPRVDKNLLNKLYKKIT